MPTSTYLKVKTILGQATVSPKSYAEFLTALRKKTGVFVYYRKGKGGTTQEIAAGDDAVLKTVRFCQSLNLIDLDRNSVRLTDEGKRGKLPGSFHIVLSDAIQEYLSDRGIGPKDLQDAIQSVRLPDAQSLHEYLNRIKPRDVTKKNFSRCLSLLAVVGSASGIVTVEAFQRKVYLLPQQDV